MAEAELTLAKSYGKLARRREDSVLVFAVCMYVVAYTATRVMATPQAC